MATVRVLRPPYIYTPWPRFLMMMVQTESCWLTATSKLLSLKCPYHQHVQKFLEIVHLWRGRDLIPGRDNTGWPSSKAMVCDQHLDSEPKSAYTWSPVGSGPSKVETPPQKAARPSFLNVYCIPLICQWIVEILMYNNMFVQCHKMFTIRYFNLQQGAALCPHSSLTSVHWCSDVRTAVNRHNFVLTTGTFLQIEIEHSI